MLDPARYPLERLADQVGTPFYLTDGDFARAGFERFARLLDAAGAVGRYAVKANPARRILELARGAGLWIDAVSGNEALRAIRAGHPGGFDPPAILLTTDVFRDNALAVVAEHGLLANLGSPGMLEELARVGRRTPVSLRVNPGFGHGDVQSCDTGGPSSKHGMWPDDLHAVARRAADLGYPVVGLHAHVGSGPEPSEFDANMKRLVDYFAALLPDFPDVAAVNLGGGIPHAYRPGAAEYGDDALRALLARARSRLAQAAGRPVRVEIEPGRRLVAGVAALVARVKDVKRTRANEKGPGQTFVMVDAGFNDLVRPAMYGAHHGIDVAGRGAPGPVAPCVVAGPLCESGDVFTRDAREFLDPRPLPLPSPGDLLVIQDAGAYGAAMSSNYVSMGRAPQVWWEGGKATLIARRESVEDLLATECEEAL